ncbi:MAG TPA: tail fiber domain-containing protein [Longimicrobium sp.]|nr:tail fiber domain-containing protein [Longimicrobium sp.]
MNHAVFRLALASAATLALASTAHAQSDILLRLRSGSPLGDRFRVDSAGGVVSIGRLGIGIIPASGTLSNEVRMMWYPNKSAFRAGGPGAAGSVAWDDANVGYYTWAGGFSTIATGLYAVALGNTTTASGTGSFAMGNTTEATGQYATAFGERTLAASRGTLAVGANCSPVATCTSAHAGTSWRSAPNSNGSSVAIGQYVTADADWAVALGFRASAAGHVGTFTFGGSLAGASAASDSIRATADGQATWRVPGGFRIFTNTAATVGVQVNAGGSSWNVISDRNRKQDFLSVDGEDLLARLRSVPVSTWRYQDEQDRTVRHIGPMAQDWQRAFGFSRDGTTINMSDFDGVNLAAIQALDRRTEAQSSQIQALRAENAELRARNQALETRASQVDALEERVRRLEALVAGSRAP